MLGGALCCTTRTEFDLENIPGTFLQSNPGDSSTFRTGAGHLGVSFNSYLPVFPGGQRARDLQLEHLF